MKTTDFDKVFAALPANKTAAIVVSEKKPEYEYTPNIKHWKAPPPGMRLIPNRPDYRGPKSGEVFGRFTVIGTMGAPKRKDGSPGHGKYVVRCTCGDYELRTSRDLRRGLDRAHHLNACFVCMRLDNLRRNRA